MKSFFPPTIVLAATLASCATNSPQVQGPRGTPVQTSSENVKDGAAWCPEHGNTAPYYHPEQSVRPVKYQPAHKDHQPPETIGPHEGDVVFAKQNRYPVRIDYKSMQSRDLGAAYQIGSDEHVLTRVYPNQVTNDWERNPLGASPYYRDPECVNKSLNLAPGLQDKCHAIHPQQRPRPTPIQPLTAEQKAAMSAAQAAMPPLYSVPEKNPSKPRHQQQLPQEPNFCLGDMTPEKDNCSWPK